MTASLKERFSSPEARHWLDRFLVSDPGFGRLRNALRVTLAAATTAFVCLPLIRVGYPIAPIFGAIIGLVSSMSVRDDTQREQKVTTLLLFAPAIGSATLGAFLSSVQWLQALVVLTVIFFALYLRRFGPRYVAVGLVTLIPLFVSSFIMFGPKQLPGIIVGAVAGVLAAYVFRFFLIPDRPERVLRGSISAFAAQLGLTLDAAISTLQDRDAADSRRKLLRREADRLNERATAAEGQLSSQETDVPRERSDKLRLYFFDAEMSASTLLETAWRYATGECDLPTEVRDSLLRALRELRAALPDEGIPPGSEEVRQALEDLESARQRASSGDRDAWWSFQVRRSESAIRQLSGAAGEDSERGPQAAEEDSGADGNENQEEQQQPAGGIIERLRPTTVQGIQAALAAGIGLLVGMSISQVRPYWVVITAYVVFLGSGTTGDTFSRGVQRVIGTFLGTVVGFFLASAVFGNVYLEVPLIVLCVFFAFYLVPISQGFLIFWIVVLLALVFDLAGRHNGGSLLLLRSLDTVAGSLIGVIVSVLVLPQRTSDRIREGTADFLGALKDYLRDQIDRLAGDEPSEHPVQEARDVEGKLRQVAQDAANARSQATVLGRSRSDLDRRVTALTALNNYARHLAGPLNRNLEHQRNERQRNLLDEIGDRLAANLDSLREAVSGGKPPEIQDVEDLLESLAEAGFERPSGEADSPNPGGSTDTLYFLRRIDQTLGELSTTLGGAGRGSKRS